MQDSLATQILELEKRLLDPQVRGSRTEIDLLLAEEFVEFGGSGTVYHKKDCAGGMPPVRIDISDFQARALGPGLALVTYRATNHEPSRPDLKHTLRCSIWRRNGGRWQMVFHQGTPTADGGSSRPSGKGT
jgi:hypothetical protein